MNATESVMLLHISSPSMFHPHRESEDSVAVTTRDGQHWDPGTFFLHFRNETIYSEPIPVDFGP
jgi:hypothetical protein